MNNQPRGGYKASDRKMLMEWMRFDFGWTLQEIGDKFGISRERVRQILGNTGSIVKQHRIDTALSSPHKTNGELADEIGISTERIASYRAGTHYKMENEQSGARVGQVAEELVAAKLESRGLSSKLMPLGHSFDILVENRLKIDVKCAHSGRIPPSLRGKAKNPRYHFRIRKHPDRAAIDFYILVIHDERDNMFVVPFDAFPMPKSDLTMSWPTARPTLGKYQKYHNRFDLLDDCLSGVT